MVIDSWRVRTTYRYTPPELDGRSRLRQIAATIFPSERMSWRKELDGSSANLIGGHCRARTQPVVRKQCWWKLPKRNDKDRTGRFILPQVSSPSLDGLNQTRWIARKIELAKTYSANRQRLFPVVRTRRAHGMCINT